MAPLLEGEGPRCTRLPFAHAFGRLLRPAAALGASGAAEAEILYRRLLREAGVPVTAAPDGQRQGAPYNLLVAGDWMLLVPRSAECFEGVSVNGLGFAGSLFVRERAQLERIRALGPGRVLAGVSG
jgi:ATP adenylyltransferase